MIVSFQHRFVFVAIPKTATHAVRAVLRPHLGPRDWEQCVLFETRLFPVDALAQIGHGHLTCRQLRPFLVPGLFEQSFKFCTTRNPYDRFVSACRFLNRENDRMRRAPLDTMKWTAADAHMRGRIHFLPQAGFVVDEDGRLLVDDVCRFESLQADLDMVCERLGLPPSPAPRVNDASGAAPRLFLDRELREIVLDRYRQDFALFGYDVALPANLNADSDVCRTAAC